MAITLLPRTEPRPQYGFLSGLTRGLGQEISQTAERKFAEYRQRQAEEPRRNALKELGFSEPLIELMQNLSPSEQWEIISNKASGIQGAQPEGFQGMGGALEGIAPQQAASPAAGSPLEQILGSLGGQTQGLEQLLGGQQGQQLRMQQAFGKQPALPQEAPQQLRQEAVQKTPTNEDILQQISRGKAAKGGTVAPGKKISATVQNSAYKAIDTAREIETIANQMKDLLDTGKVFSGIRGRVSPTQLQNDETQQFEALSNELASLLAARSGVATNFKIKLAQSMKPNIQQNPGTQRHLVNKLIESAQDLRRNASERLGEPVEEARREDKSQQKFASLPAANSLPAGTIVRDTDKNQRYKTNGTSWSKV